MSQIPPVLNLREEDVKRMVACNVHIGSLNMDVSMERYVYKRNENGNHIIDLRKTWEKLQLAARAIICVENPKDVCAVALSGQNAVPYAQRAVLKLGQYIKCRTIAGRFTPGTFTNQQQSHFFEPRLLIASDTIKDHQPIVEASYVNMPVIAFCNANSSLRGIDIAIPCNTTGKNSIALMYWLLAREVLRLQNAIPHDKEWDVMHKKIIKFLVSGQKFECTEDILIPVKNTLLGRTLYDDKVLYKNSEGYFFFDRTPQYFEMLLDYLRTKKLAYPTNPKAKEKFKKELAYFAIDENLF